MKLLIDAGNTRVKWALHDGAGFDGRFLATGEAIHAVDNAIPDMIGQVEAALADNQSEQLSEIAVVSVGGADLRADMVAALSERFHVDPRMLLSESGFGRLVNGYSDPEQLGADRWIAMIGAAASPIGSICLVDAGTAITVDVVDAAGAHLGGIILPGISLMQESLFERTGDIGRFAQRERSDAAEAGLGRGTLAAVHHGALHAAAGAVRSVCSARHVDQLLITGGDAELLLPLLADFAPEHRPHLVLEGAAIRRQQP